MSLTLKENHFHCLFKSYFSHKIPLAPKVITVIRKKKPKYENVQFAIKASECYAYNIQMHTFVRMLVGERTC